MIRTLTKNICALTAYLIGVRRDLLMIHYKEYDSFHDEKGFELLDQEKPLRIIRSLCKIRSSMLLKYRKINNQFIYDNKNITELETFSNDNLQQLQKWGINIIRYNYSASKYLVDLNKFIAESIDECRNFYPEWVEWDIIRSLFVMPNGSDEESFREEYKKVYSQLDFYPYRMYINWEPYPRGNILHNDRKFLKIIYRQHGKYFSDNRKVIDANEEIKENIYDFIENNESTAIVVDCENSNVFKLYAVLKNLNQEEIKKIKKIILFDDKHTFYSWQLLCDFVDIEVEYIKVERINDNKSLVDIRMATGICYEHFKKGVSSFILVSSDSDFWGLISGLPEVDFLVMIEYNKCGNYTKEALRDSGIFYCSIDDFSTGNIDDFKNAVLIDELEYQLDGILQLNGNELMELVYKQSGVLATETEHRKFFDKYIRKLRLHMDLEGNIRIKVPEN